MKTDKIIEAVEKLSVLELVELKKALEEVGDCANELKVLGSFPVGDVER